MYKFLCLLLFSFALNLGFSQTEEDFIQIIKVNYAKNNKSKACEESKKGLTKFPNSARIAKLQALVCSSTGGSQEGGSQAGGSITGGSQTGGISTGGSQTGGTTTGGATTGGATTGGATTGGTEVQESKIINLNTGFKRITGENRVEWSKALADNAESITVVFSVNGLTFNYNATGKTYCDYEPGTSKAEARKTTVQLIVDWGNRKVNPGGEFKLTDQYFKCSKSNSKPQ
jgi:hypothetical protein